MKTTFLFIALFTTSIPLLSNAEELSIHIRTIETSVSQIKQSGFDTMLLPLKQPVNPEKPERLPLDGTHPFRGLLQPNQNEVFTRESEHDFGTIRQKSSEKVTAPAKINLKNNSGNTTFTFTASFSKDKDLQVNINSEDIVIWSGQTLLFAFPGKTPDSADIYLVTIAKTQG